MSAQFKLDQKSISDQDDKEAADQKINKRPNIDHLLKRISIERNKEKKNSFIVLVLGIIVIGITAALFI